MAVKQLSKRELRDISETLKPTLYPIRDWIHVSTKPLPKVEYLPELDEGACAWYVVMTNPRCEHRAQTGLIEKGFGVYLPQYRLEKIIKRRGGGVRAIINRTLFPRYMFVWAPHGSWPRITSADGVECLVREFGRYGPPVTIPSDDIKMLMDRQNAGAFDEMMDRQKGAFAKGDCVRVIKGPFFTFQAVVEKALSGKNVDILVELFGKPHKVRVPVDHLESLC